MSEMTRDSSKLKAQAIDAVAENVFRIIMGLIMLMALFASIYGGMAP